MLVELVLESVPPIFTWRNFLLEVVPELVLLDQRFVEAPFECSIGNHQHSSDTIFAKILVVVSQASLDTPSFLIVRQADDQPVENQTDQGSGGKIIKYFIPSLRVGNCRAKPSACA